MKVNPRDADAFAHRPPSQIRGILFYGPNTGLVEERAAATVGAVAADTKDPFSFVELTASALRGNAARLADEASTLSLSGHRRVIRLRETGEAAYEPCARAMELPWESLLVIEAGELSPRSRLRALFEKETDLAAIACYDDDAQGLMGLVSRTLEEAGLRAERGVAQWIAGNLGSDRRVSRMELNKLVLYMKGKQVVTIRDAQAIVGDTAAVTLDDVSGAASSGQLDRLITALARARFEGIGSVTLLSWTLRHLSRLEEVLVAMERGTRTDVAINSLRPPVFWKQKEAFQNQLRHWSLRSIRRARTELLEADLNCKNSSLFPAELQNVVCERALMRIAAMGGARMPGARR